MHKVAGFCYEWRARFSYWIREYRKELLVFLVVWLLASASFALGYLYAKEYEAVPIVIEKQC